MTAATTGMRRLDAHSIPVTTEEIRLITQVRNERLRMPWFLEHHRRIGVHRFFVIDNGSTDGTAELLLDEPDVHVFHTTEPYREKRRAWKQHILDAWGRGSWTLHLDADELFVFPRMEQLSLPGFCRFVEEEGARAVHATMVDLYGQGAIRDTAYRAGESLLEACPWFDAEGYWLRWEGAYKSRRRQRSPRFSVTGGPRLRLFHPGSRDRGAWRERLASWLYDIRRTRPPFVNRWRPAFKLAHRLAGGERFRLPPNMSKVPLVRWGEDLRLENPAFHYLTPVVPLSACWAGILHFKYLADFEEKVHEAVAREQHVDRASDYRHYQAALRREHDLVVFAPCSRRYESSASLVEAGLMRASRRLDAFVERESGRASA